MSAACNCALTSGPMRDNSTSGRQWKSRQHGGAQARKWRPQQQQPGGKPSQQLRGSHAASAATCGWICQC
eukprot:14962950-Alexandrium_andersonii.AAC.1